MGVVEYFQISQALIMNSAVYFLLLPSLVFGLRIMKKEMDIPEPPPHQEVAKMSRYLTHYNDYTALATISIREDIEGYPFAASISYADGILGQSSGTPYFYMTAMDIQSKDLVKNPTASIALSLAQTGYCTEHNMDAQDPLCAHVILTGKIVTLEKGSKEEAYAKEALFSRHPAMVYWPADHGFYFTKLDIESIILLDFYGGASQVPVTDYFAATLN